MWAGIAARRLTHQAAVRSAKQWWLCQSRKAGSGSNRIPDFIAWHVANRGEKSFRTKVGAAWFHRDRKGICLQLEVVPINGRIVLRTPLDDEAKEQPGA